MTKQDILNGMSEEEFYQLYPTKESWEQATQMKLGGLSGAPHNGQPTADQFFNYGSHALDKFNIPFGHFAYGGSLYKAKYGFNNAVNYGSFSVPMQEGGDPNAVWLAQEQFALQKRTKQGIPSGVKPTGTNPLNFNPFMKGSDIANPDSVHTSPYNPNIAAYFKGNKVIAGPAVNSGQAKKEAMMINRGKMFKKDNEIFPNYIQQDGGALDPSNNQMYPILDFGGLKSIINSSAKHMKKAYGGDLTEQGGNQDYKKQYRSTFDNYIKQNTYNAIVDAEQQAMMDELQQMPYAQNGKMVLDKNGVARTPEYMEQQKQMATFKGSNMICTAAGCFPNPHPGHVEPTTNYNNNTAQREAMANQIAQKQGASFGDLADTFAPTKRSYNWNLGNYPKNMLNSYLPMNELFGYEFGKKDYQKLKEMGDQGQVTGMQMNYGPLGRMMPRMFGPRSVTFGTIGPDSKGYFEDLKAPVDSNAGPAEQAGQKPGVQDTPVDPVRKANIEKMMNPFSEDAQRQMKIMKGLPDTGWEDVMNASQKKVIPMAGYRKGGNPISYDQWAESLRFKAPIIDDSEDMPPVMGQPAEQKPLDFSDVAGIQKNRQQQRDMFGAPMGDQPDILKPENVTAKRQTYWGDAAKYMPGAFNALAAGIEQRHDRPEMKAAQLAMMTPGSDIGPFQSVPATGRRMGDYDPNSGMFRPNQMVPVQFQGNLYGYSQMGGANEELEEGEETELSPEEIAELRAQGYEIEELD